MNHPAMPDLYGKVVFVRVQGENSSWPLVDCNYEYVDEAPVLTGRFLESPGKRYWARKATYHIPWKSVVYLMIFESLEDYRNASAEWYRDNPTST